ncbi:hypothetical protein C8Q74DRAFT_1276174 [Fomes fomentarius]|nr:hypothetical protein C8Q74DRAFT_1276174 [Fomes fomentarius]
MLTTYRRRQAVRDVLEHAIYAIRRRRTESASGRKINLQQCLHVVHVCTSHLTTAATAHLDASDGVLHDTQPQALAPMRLVMPINMHRLCVLIHIRLNSEKAWIHSTARCICSTRLLRQLRRRVRSRRGRRSRASLQAQLALLAARRTKIADSEEEDGDGPALPAAAPVPPPAQAKPTPQLPPPPAPSTHHHPLPQPQPRVHVQPYPPQQQLVPPKPVELSPPPIAAYSGARTEVDGERRRRR